MRVSHRLRHRLRIVPPYLVAVLGMAAITPAVFLLGPQRLTNAAMLYLAAVLITAVMAGPGPAIAASLAAFLTMNFLFTEPRYTFSVRDPSVLLVLVTFLLVAIVTSQLAAAQRARVVDAEQREREARLLHDVSELLTGSSMRAAILTVAERIRAELQLTAVAIDLRASDPSASPMVAGDAVAMQEARKSTGTVSVLGAGESASAERSGRVGRWVRVSVPHGEGAVATGGLIRVPIRAGALALGDLLLVGRGDPPLGHRDARLLATAAAQLGLAIQQERMRRQANEAEVLRRSDELKNALLDAVSHDLRTPLSSIIASAGTLRLADVEWSEAERQGFAGAIEKEAERLNRIVGNLLDLSRIQGGALTPARDWHDPGLLLHAAMERLRSAYPDHRMILDIPADLPPILLDPVEIDQVLVNLVENAAKYSPAGGEIRVAAAIDRGELRVAVDDRGPGLPSEGSDRLFEPFYRLPSHERAGGSGLGLAVARGLVVAHGGRIWAENRRGGGARFTFTLPIGPIPEAAQ